MEQCVGGCSTNTHTSFQCVCVCVCVCVCLVCSNASCCGELDKHITHSQLSIVLTVTETSRF